MGRYLNISTRYTEYGKRYKSTTKYPDIPLSYDDVYVYTDIGDRFDILAQNYFGNSNLWWVLSIANPQLEQNTIYPPMGVQIRIPGNIGRVLLDYDQLNSK
jgi:hypothetical protein|tara:strand:- start:729 stop:1031 length:303 start_codon:yes stop_codon:yes gene_type:complete